jgi:hypothetical protein
MFRLMKRPLICLIWLILTIWIKSYASAIRLSGTFLAVRGSPAQNVELRVSGISSHWADGIVDQSDLELDLRQEKAGAQFAADHYNRLRMP